VSFAHFLGLVRNETEFMAYDGLHKAIVLSPEMIALQMKDVDGYKMFGSDYFMDTGSPQYVTFVENLRNTPVYEKGQQIRYDPLISQNGTNVNFVYKESLNQISVRTYERGVENETLACGTGSIASAISAYLKFQPDKSSFIVNVLGGKLKVDFIPADNNSFRDIWLTGPANFVYQGTVPVE
jgi:diaminopimelate epimerase